MFAIKHNIAEKLNSTNTQKNKGHATSRFSVY